MTEIGGGFVGWLIRRAMKRPWKHIAGYMERYWLVSYWGKGRWDWLPAIRVHHILRSDNDRHFHDHPYDFVSIILRGGYTEVRPTWDKSDLYLGNSQKWYPPGSILFRRATDYHKLILPDRQTCWTLFISFKWKQKWGFLMAVDKKMRYEKYLNLKDGAER